MSDDIIDIFNALPDDVEASWKETITRMRAVKRPAQWVVAFQIEEGGPIGFTTLLGGDRTEVTDFAATVMLSLGKAASEVLNSPFPSGVRAVVSKKEGNGK